MGLIKNLLKKIPQIEEICSTRDYYFTLSERLSEEKHRITNEKNEISKQLNEANNEISVLNTQLNEANNKISVLNTQLMETDKKIALFENQLNENKEKINNLTDELNQIKQKYNELESLSIKYSSDVISKEFWENHYKDGGNSGTGSYLRLARFKADVINKFIKENKLNNLIELGCGDGNLLSLLEIENYTGVDVSKSIIEKNKKYWEDDLSNVFFTVDEREKYFNRKYELSISIDVIFHLIEEDVYENYMNDLFNLSNKFVIIYSSNHEEFTRWKEYRHRKFMKYVQENINNYELIEFIPSKYPYIVGKENETSSSDFYIFKRLEE